MEEIRTILVRRNKQYLAQALESAHYVLDVSSTYGSRYCSLLTTVELYVPFEQFEELNPLGDDDKNEIISAFHIFYPVKDREPEITDIELFPDPQSINVLRGQMSKETRISARVCSLVNDLLLESHIPYTHDSLDELFRFSGAPGDPPTKLGDPDEKMPHHSKWKTWLRRASDDDRCDAHAILGKVLEEIMEVDPKQDERGYQSFDTRKKELKSALAQDGLRYRRGGIIEVIPQGLSTKALSEALSQRNFDSLEIEFERALEHLQTAPALSVTAACTILETLFRTYLECCAPDEIPKKKAIKPLWTIVQKHLGLDPKEHGDDDIKKILSGMSSVIDGIGAFRTHAGSAHGGGVLRYNVKPRHAKLTVNSAHTLALFVIETWEEKES